MKKILLCFLTEEAKEDFYYYVSLIIFLYTFILRLGLYSFKMKKILFCCLSEEAKEDESVKKKIKET